MRKLGVVLVAVTFLASTGCYATIRVPGEGSEGRRQHEGDRGHDRERGDDHDRGGHGDRHD